VQYKYRNHDNSHHKIISIHFPEGIPPFLKSSVIMLYDCCITDTSFAMTAKYGYYHFLV